MAGPTELPELVSEFVDMSKQYLRQETVEPAKRLGRVAGMGFGAAILFSLGTLFLAIAGTRFVVWLMPSDLSHSMWTGLGYIVAALLLFLVAGLVAKAASR